MRRKLGYPCYTHRIRFRGSYCPECYRERRIKERQGR